MTMTTFTPGPDDYVPHVELFTGHPVWLVFSKVPPSLRHRFAGKPHNELDDFLDGHRDVMWEMMANEVPLQITASLGVGKYRCGEPRMEHHGEPWEPPQYNNATAWPWYCVRSDRYPAMMFDTLASLYADSLALQRPGDTRGIELTLDDLRKPGWVGETEKDHCGPNYSTDMAAAWKVVEKMKGNGWRTDIAVAPHSDGPSICSFSACDAPTAIGTARAAPLAICLAALRAHGIDVEVRS